MDVKLQIKNVTEIKLEPTWSDGDYLENLTLTVVDSLSDEVKVRLIPVADKKMDLLFPDPPAGLDGLERGGFVDVTNEGNPDGELADAREKFTKLQVARLEDFMREQVELESAPPGVYDFAEELSEVMDALHADIDDRLGVALNAEAL